MGNVAIVTDSNSGISQAEGKELGIYVIPMPFLVDGKLYFESCTFRCPADLVHPALPLWDLPGIMMERYR